MKPGIQRVYDVYEYFDEKREALELWAGVLRQIVEPPPTSNVVPIRADAQGFVEACDAILARLPNAPLLYGDESEETTAKETIRIALVGRPNAGKSSLVNRFLGEERMLVDSEPGTTRDPLDTEAQRALFRLNAGGPNATINRPENR